MADKATALACFNAFDKDGSGKITPDELKQALSDLKGKFGKDDAWVESTAGALLVKADTDKDQKISRKEFLAELGYSE